MEYTRTQLESMKDIELSGLYDAGVDMAGSTLFMRHRDFLDRIADSCGVPIEPEERRLVVYGAFASAAPFYESRNGASFRTYIRRCARNALMTEARKLHTDKRKASMHEVSIDTEYWQKMIERKLAREWIMAGNGDGFL